MGGAYEEGFVDSGSTFCSFHVLIYFLINCYGKYANYDGLNLIDNLYLKKKKIPFHALPQIVHPVRRICEMQTSTRTYYNVNYTYYLHNKHNTKVYTLYTLRCSVRRQQWI